MKLAAVVAILFVTLAGTAQAQPRTLYLVNHSTVISDVELNRDAAAIQQQVTLDFAPAWNIDAQIVVSPTPPDGAWTLEIMDQATIQGALGYHDVCHTDGHGVPCGFVFAQTALDAGDSVSVTISHELLEILADPFTTSMAKVGSRFYILEDCDAVESETYAYERQGVLLSDFVFPAWFRPGHVGPYDYAGVVDRPLQLMPGGYISFWQNGSWHQDFKRGLRGVS